MIRACPRAPSVAPGAALCLHVATASARFRVAFYRWADGPQLMHRSGWLPGADALERGPDQDWDWPGYAFAIPAGWPSSVYIADLEEEGRKRSFDVAREWGAALFVVRAARTHAPAPLSGHAPARARRMLYKLPLATYHAYNCSGGGCFYFQTPRSHQPPGARLSLRRPGGGIGWPVWCAPDHYDASSPRQTFAHWDARFIRWLARSGYTADFCTDLDLHADPGLLDGYALLAAAPLDGRWQELPAREHEGAGAGIHAAALGLYQGKGTVFAAGSTDWPQVLARARDRRVERITQNVLDHLLQA